MSHVFQRHSHAHLPRVAKAEGCYLFDTDGKSYFDGSGGAAVSCLGHGDRQVLAAIQAQLTEAAYAHTSFFTSQPAEDLAALLCRHAPYDAARKLDKVYFLSGGSEVIETALKLARQYFFERGERRHRVIARRQSYHGNTLGALATGGNPWRRAPFADLMIETHHISPCYEYRGRQVNETSYEYGQRVAQELHDKITELGADTVMAFVAEPVVGATLGAVPAVEGYFKRIREICDEFGVLLILDEVMCGMGRTGTLFAYEQEAVVPDIVTIAKGLGGGYQPISAMLATDTLHRTIAEGSGFFQHGHTYMGHPSACAAGLAVVKAILERDLLPQVNHMGGLLEQALRDAFGQHPHIGDIRGRGLFWGLEIVQDRSDKTPFAPEQSLHAKIKQAAFAAGLLCYPMGGTSDGQSGDHILLAPPFIMQEQHIAEIIDKLKQALTVIE